MAKNQTFSVSLSLLTKNFQKGVKTVQTSLNNLKMQFRNFAAALGAGIGITEIIRNMVDSAKQLDKAQTVLKNVSDGLLGYAQNQEFVMELSKKYNQEITVLMGNYAKFHSAANMANMSMEEQTKIYEALTRAGTYYSLTADEMNGVMLAVNQMISKGKVSSEELRRQLGERLPGAMNLAAKAMGVTTAELDKMIRDGKVMATELLPLLAEELNNVTQNLDVNTVQGGLARMKNAFTDLTSKLNVGEIYKKIINGVAAGLEYISRNLETVKQKTLAVFLSLVGGTVWNKLKANFNAYVAEIQASLGRANSLLMTHKSQLTGLSNKGLIELDFDENKFITGIRNIGNLTEAEFQKASQHVANYNKYLGQSIELSKQKTTALGWLGSGLKKLGAAMKSMLSSFAPMLIIYAITTIIQKVREWKKEQDRIKSIVKETRKEYEKLANSFGSNETELTAVQTRLNEKDNDGNYVLQGAERARVITRLNQLLGLQGKEMLSLETSNDDINAKIQERLDLLEQERKYQAALKVVEEKRNRVAELGIENDSIREDIEASKKNLTGNFTVDLWDALGLPRIGGDNTGIKEGEIKDNNWEIAELNKAIAELEPIITELGADAVKRLSIINNEGYDPNATPDTTEYQKLMEDYQKIQIEYNNSLRALKDKKQDGIITEEEYNEALEELYQSTLDSIYALNDINENSNPFAKALKEAYLTLLKNKKKEDEVQKALDKYYEGVQKLYNQYNNGVITQEELETELYNLLEEVTMATSAMGDLSGASELLAAEFLKKKKELANKKASEIENPTSGTRDNTFDYNKSQSDILGEVADIYREYEDNLKNTIEELSNLEPTDEIKQRLQELNAELLRTTYNAETMEDAFKFAKISEDIKSLEQELSEGIWDNFTGIADAVDRVTSSIKDMVEVMEDPETDGWEKVLSLFNAITQITDTILQSVQMISQLTEVMDKLKQAEAAYQAVQAAGTAQTVAGAATTVVAKQAEATASGTAEAAKLPFPANLLAILGIVGLITSIFAGLPKFAHGGIVQGASTIGDNNLARVNAGEMILNKQQQATLFGMLNGSNSGALGKNGGQVEFKIKGADLVGTINNYNSRKRG